jgi:hypothetical protein
VLRWPLPPASPRSGVYAAIVQRGQAILCLAQYSRRVTPLCSKSSTTRRSASLLRILPFSAASPDQSIRVPRTLILNRLFHVSGHPPRITSDERNHYRRME